MIAGFLRSSGRRVKTFDSALSLLDSAHVRDIAFLIADVRMPVMSGIELHGELLAGGAPPVIFHGRRGPRACRCHDAQRRHHSPRWRWIRNVNPAPGSTH
ncbi:response regulator [Burkholderia sp. Ax-1735]|nr:response regulator [Burkholderia sp. Ap-955]NIF08814.1 response regulator [Burkholderia sp. Ax-1735]NIG05897.1 response regulator [Burkholderia sp. Tr-849]